MNKMTVLLALVTVLFVCLHTALGQSVAIFPANTIDGQVGQNISFACRSNIVADSNSLEVYLPDQNIFVSADDSRIIRNDELSPGLFTNYTFGPLVTGDNGTLLRCTSGMVSTNNLTINVVFEPIITPITPIDNGFRLREGQALEVRFEVMANPPISSYRWRKNGMDLPSRIAVTSNSISFSPTNRNDTGTYTLSVTNAVNTREISFVLNVTYLAGYSASVTNGFNCSETNQEYVNCSSNVGASGMLLCRPDGYPMPTVNITSTASQSSNFVISNDGAISITSVAAGNAGMYTCSATIDGEDFPPVFRKFRFFVGGVARPLGRISVQFTDNSVIFTWNYDNSLNGVPAETFVVSITLRGGTTVTVPISANLRSVTVPLSQLESNQMYDVRAVVRNLQGDSEPISNSFTAPDGAGNGSDAVSSCLGLLTLLLLGILWEIC